MSSQQSRFDTSCADDAIEPRCERYSIEHKEFKDEDDVKFAMSEEDRRICEHGMQKFTRLGWKRLAMVLFVTAIALGSLSIPSSFASLGMVPGIICCVGIGLVSIYTSFIVGQVKLKFPNIANYADAGRLMWGRVGYEVFNVMIILQLILIIGSHCLTGTIAFQKITESQICAIVFGVISAVILLILAIPPSFADVAILGYIDFISIILAIIITMAGAAREKNLNFSHGISSPEWSAWPRENTTFTEAFIAITNIVFAYSFALCQFSFMDEMHTPRDYMKSVWVLGALEILIYTVTGAVVYSLVGQEVKSPAILSAGSTMSRVGFGIALPVIFISGSINTVVLGRLVHGRIFRNSTLQYVNTRLGWITWLAVITVATIISFVVAEVIPFFPDLLSLVSALFISGFTFYFPAIMWFMILRQGKWTLLKNILLSILNLVVILIGLIVLVGGTYSSVQDIVS